jgi:dTDP-4-dehydrorhamnose reductase
LRVLVVGEGLIGAALARHLERQGHSVVPTSRRPDAGGGFLHLDLAEPQGWSDLPDVDAAVLCAAVARLADCDADPEGSARINVAGCVELAQRLAGRGAQAVLLSTDKVFDGARAQRRRDEPPCPATEYGRQKAVAEEGVLNAGDRTAVLRLTKVLDARLPLIEGWRRDLAARRPITPFSNMFCAPVTVDLVMEMATRLLEEGRAGIFHCSGAEESSYQVLAEALADRWGGDRNLIEPVEAASPPEHRPPHSTLDMSLEEALFGIHGPTLTELVERIA